MQSRLCVWNVETFSIIFELPGAGLERYFRGGRRLYY